MRDLLLKPDKRFSDERYLVIHSVTGRLIGQISHERGLITSWHWSVQHPFEQCRSGQQSGREETLETAITALRRYWRDSPLPAGMVEHEGYSFLPFKPPRDITWTIKITRREAVPFLAPGFELPGLIAWVRFPEAESESVTVTMAKRAIDDWVILIPPSAASPAQSDS